MLTTNHSQPACEPASEIETTSETAGENEKELLLHAKATPRIESTARAGTITHTLRRRIFTNMVAGRCATAAAAATHFAFLSFIFCVLFTYTQTQIRTHT